MLIEAAKVGARFRVVGSELKRMLEVGASSGGSSGPGFENAEVVPSIGILWLQVEGLRLFIDCFGK